MFGNVGDVKRRESVHHVKPGHEAGARDAAEPDVSNPQDREISFQGRFEMTGLGVSRLRFSKEAPKQQTQDDAWNSSDEEGGAPPVTGGDLRGEHGSDGKSHKSGSADDDADVSSSRFGSRRRFHGCGDCGPSRAFRYSH